MTQITLTYVQAFKDRHGKQRFYFRRPGHDRRRLPGIPGSAEFMAAYEAAVSGATAPARQIGAERTKAGTINALIIAYYQSAEFLTLAPLTQSTYRGILERFRSMKLKTAKIGDADVARLEARHIRDIMDSMADRPSAANHLRRMLHTILTFAMERGWRPDNPAAAVKRVRTPKVGFRTWTEENIAAYEKRWPTGSRERLALYLLLYTAQRRGDVVKIGRQHRTAAGLRIKPGKTENSTGKWLTIPVHPRLAAELDRVPGDQLTYIQTAYGKPFSPAGFTSWFVEASAAAGVENMTPHGGRKAASRRLAEAGCSASIIQATTGHAGLREVSLYTEAADQESRARLGIEAISRTSSVKPQRKV